MDLATDTLLSTKLRPPEARPKLVARSRLTEKLEREAGRRLTLLSAPAGFGKSTLLGEWLSQEERPAAWVSLDEGDNDPARFLSYLVAGLRSVDEGVGDGIPAALRSPEPPSIEAATSVLVNDLASLSHEEECTIILDDYHVIEAEAVHGIVSLLLDRLPAGAHLVIASRVDPPLSLSRLRARGQMGELRSADLRFTPEEARSFLVDVMGLELSGEVTAALERRTEGWVAGLQLAALSMQDRRDISRFVEAFSGSHRDVLDYLAEEVLDGQPEGVRGFLVETSILTRLTGSLCDALTGRADGQEMLERLERENLFVVALDDERVWYRYHHLFSDFLRGRLGREKPSLVGKLHLRASDWYEQRGLIYEAIPHALAASDHRQERAARLIEAGILAAGRRGEFPTALRWVETLSTEAKRRHPRLFTEHALGLTLVGRPDDIEPLLEEAERASGEAAAGEDRDLLLGFAAAVRAGRANLRGDAPEAVEFARRALSLLPEEHADYRNFAAICLGEGLRDTGELAAANEALAEATEMGLVAGHVYGTLTGMVFRARVQAERGRLGEADEAFRRALGFVSERGVELLPAAGLAHIGMGALLYERNELDAAERELAGGVELAERASEFSRLVWGYAALSRTKLARGDGEGALEMAREAERIARGSGADLQIALAASWMARLRLGRGDIAEAVALEQRRAASNDAADTARRVDRLTSARLLYARDRHDEALRLLEELHEEAETTERTGSAIEILALRALSLQEKGKKERAVGALARALALAEPEGYVRTFVDEGPPMAELLSLVLEARQRGNLDPPVPAHYLRKLLAALERDDSSTTPADHRLPEPLSERELEVLALVAAGKTNREVASDLFVAQSTVKTHVKNVYRKLDARNRAQALARARELDLI